MSARGIRFHSLAYLGAIAVASVLFLMFALLTGGWFGLSAGIGVAILLVFLAVPGAVLSVLTILGHHGISRQRRRLLTSLVFGMSSVLLAEIYAANRLSGPYDFRPSLPALAVLVGMPAMIAGYIFGRLETSELARRSSGEPPA